MDHGGKQCDLRVLIGPGAPQNLPIQREHQITVAITCRAFMQPGTDNKVQHVRVDLCQDIPNRALARRLVPRAKIIVGRPELGEKALRKVASPSADLAVVRGASECRDNRDSENTINVVDLSAGRPEIFHLAQHLEKSAGRILAGVVMAVRQGGAGLA